MVIFADLEKHEKNMEFLARANEQARKFVVNGVQLRKNHESTVTKIGLHEACSIIASAC